MYVSGRAQPNIGIQVTMAEKAAFSASCRMQKHQRFATVNFERDYLSMYFIHARAILCCYSATSRPVFCVAAIFLWSHQGQQSNF
eukprot:scaffold23904_cov62-Attheya_sp.AAC.1